MFFDGIAIGSPVTATQINALTNYALYVRDNCPCVSSFTYLGPQGTVATGIKDETEYSTAIAVPVPTIVGGASEILHVLPAPLAYEGVDDTSLPQSQLSWEFRARYSRGALNTYQTQILPTQWVPYQSAAWLAEITDDVSFGIDIASPTYSYFCGALLSVRLRGTFGYGGNLPNFTAFLTA